MKYFLLFLTCLLAMASALNIDHISERSINKPRRNSLEPRRGPWRSNSGGNKDGGDEFSYTNSDSYTPDTTQWKPPTTTRSTDIDVPDLGGGGGGSGGRDEEEEEESYSNSSYNYWRYNTSDPSYDDNLVTGVASASLLNSGVALTMLFVALVAVTL